MTDPLDPNDNSGMKWTTEEDKQLIRYLNVNLKHAQIAELMGRTVASVAARVVKLTKIKVETEEKRRDSQKREDVRFLMDVLRDIHPITGETLEANSPWRNEVVVSDIKKYLDENETIKRHPNQLHIDSGDFVKIEELESMTFVNEKWKTLEFDFHSSRELNFLEGKLLNNRFPYTEEEFALVEHMYSSHKDLNELERIFQRSKSSLVNILKNRGIEFEDEVEL